MYPQSKYESEPPYYSRSYSTCPLELAGYHNIQHEHFDYYIILPTNVDVLYPELYNKICETVNKMNC